MNAEIEVFTLSCWICLDCKGADRVPNYWMDSLYADPRPCPFCGSARVKRVGSDQFVVAEKPALVNPGKGDSL